MFLVLANCQTDRQEKVIIEFLCRSMHVHVRVRNGYSTMLLGYFHNATRVFPQCFYVYVMVISQCFSGIFTKLLGYFHNASRAFQNASRAFHNASTACKSMTDHLGGYTSILIVVFSNLTPSPQDRCA